ncbi:MAG TPA: phosphorylase [Anaerolineae bacterium]|nr:phosphorylase [Anaerolineae bacterium]HIP71533.1 phosphorylase [Anaerolineae bacterium]
MSLPHNLAKYNQPGILTAVNMAEYRNQKRPSPPETMILGYQTPLLRHAVKSQKGKKVDGFPGETYLLGKTDGRVGVAGRFGIGAPMTAVLVEDLAAWGARQFVIIGLAGTISPDLQPGDVTVADKALRDEGTSHHYLPPQRYVDASPRLTAVSQQALTQQNIPFATGPTWTTDAPYRETAVEVSQYQQEGILTVDMEAAALFAVAEYLELEATAVFCISDSIAHGRWQPVADRKAAERRLFDLFDALIPIFRNQ